MDRRPADRRGWRAARAPATPAHPRYAARRRFGAIVGTLTAGGDPPTPLKIGQPNCTARCKECLCLFPNVTSLRGHRAPQRHRGRRGLQTVSFLYVLCASVVKGSLVVMLILNC